MTFGPLSFSSSYEAYFVKRLLSRPAGAGRLDTPADRVAAVAQIQINPRRYVGYIGQTVAFRALPLNTNGQTIQGVPFEWDSSDSGKASIDDAGHARLVQSGLVRITCHVGNVQASIPLLVRPGARPLQSDVEWQADQQSLTETTTTGVNIGSAVEHLAATLAEHLAPTAQAQAGWSDDLAYDELWSDPRNLVGSPRNRASESTRAGEVLPEGSNFDFAVPIINLAGRGVNASLTLYYNSRLWSRRNTSMAYNAIVGWPGPGYSLGFGRIVTYEVSGGPNATCKYLLMDRDGTRHYLGSGSYNGSGAAFETNDGSHIVYFGNGSNGGDLHYPGGERVTFTMVNNRLLPTAISDTNGNYLQIAYKPECIQIGGTQFCDVFAPIAIDYITDTMGRIVQFNYDSNYRLTSITAPGFGGTAQNPVTQTIAQFDYQTVTANGTFSGLTVERAAGNIVTLKHIYFAATGTGYLLSNSIYGMVSTISGRRQMSVSNGIVSDGVESNNVTFNYPTSGPISDAPTFTQRTESAVNAPQATYTYSSSTNSIAKTKTYTITQPDTSTINLTRSTDTSLVANGLLVQSEIKNGSGGTMVKTVTAYANDPGGEVQVQSIVSYDNATPTPNQTKVDYDYDSYGNITNTREYGFQINGQYQVRKRTRILYKTDTNYVNGFLRGLAIEIDIYDGLLNTNDADDVLLAKTTRTYDDYSAMSGMEDYRDPNTGQLPPNPPGHIIGFDAGYLQRGNVTGTTQWYDLTNNLSYTHLRKIDVFGSTVKEQLACCNEQTQMASQKYYWAVPEQWTKGASGGPQLTYSAQFDFNTLAANWNKDPNNQEMSVDSYDAALRATQVTTPNGKVTSATYDDGALATTQTVTYDGGSTQATITTTQSVDGWGRVITDTNVYGGQVNTTYDAMERVASVSNPFAIGGSPAYWTSYTYDALGRKTIVTLPDSQTLQTSYSGNVATETDQVNRKMQRVTDGFGRLTTVNEQDASGFLTQATNYAYDLLGNLTQINQGNQLRSYKYDSLSRRTGQKIPEQGDPTQANQWTTTFTYTDFDAVATRTDARGVITSNTYDTLNRWTQVSYNTVSGVTTAPTVTYNYDSYNGTTANGKLIRVGVGTDYEERYTFDPKFRIASTIRTIGARSYTTSYVYNAGDQLTQATYPSGQLLYYRHDSHGMTSSLGNYPSGGSGTDYVTGHTHDIAGQLSSISDGNGVTEQYGYDPARMQMISHKAGTTSPYTNRMDVTYYFGASAGQMGVGSTAGNAGQLMSISGTINGTTESAAYTYDNYDRLVTSSQTSNSSSGQRRFVFDRWGNRSATWDATSGGNQIQSVSLQTANFPGTGSAPTNRISAVGGTSYSYDANGNTTSDGVHTYTYDSNNRLVSVDGGGTASYSFDHQNRRYRTTVGSSVTHYVWEANKVIAEHNGSTGAVLVNYIYAGSRMILSGGYYLLGDRLSGRLTLNASGTVKGRQAHLPFGEDFAESGTQEKHHFTSYERDSQSGTDYALNRSYSSSVGRFQSADPFQDSADASMPQSWNRYAYVMNDPIGFIDATGLNRFLPGDGDICGGLGGDPVDPPVDPAPVMVYSKIGPYITDFFQANTHCEQDFRKRGVDYNAFLAKANNANGLDFTNPANEYYAGRTFANLPLPDGRHLSGPQSNVTPQALLNAVNPFIRRNTYEVTFKAQSVIAYGYLWQQLSGGLKLAYMAHEVFHLYFNQDAHIPIAKALKLKFKGGEEAASDSLTDWLAADCVEKKK